MIGAGVRLGKKTVPRYNSLYRDRGGLMTGVIRVAIHGVYCDIKSPTAGFLYRDSL